MLTRFREWWIRLRDPGARAEWAIRHLGLTVSSDPPDAPGLVLIQIDGLARREMEAALEIGRMPFLKRLREATHTVRDFYPGLPSTTPAVQAEILYGVRSGVPAFSFMNRADGEVTSMFNPEVVKEHEAEFARTAPGLLEGGSSWSNIYAGGAGPGEAHFCLSSLGLSDIFERGGLSARIFLSLLHIPAVLQIAAMAAVEFFLGLASIFTALLRGRPLSSEFAAFFSRLCVGVGMRELITIGASLDLVRGHRIVHVNFLGYDEMAHLHGPSSRPALWMLKGIDRAVARLVHAAGDSRRRRYSVWVFSDHGQDPTDSLELTFPGGFRKKLGECLRSPVALSRQQLRLIRRRPWTLRQFQRQRRFGTAARPIHGDRFSFAALGPVGHLYVADALDDHERFSIARTLVAGARVPAVLFLRPAGRVAWIDAEGEALDDEGILERLKNRPPELRRQLLEDLRGLLAHENAGDFVLLGHSGSGPSFAFSLEWGSHGGLGHGECHGFVLAPSGVEFPLTAFGFVRPHGLREAARRHIGSDQLPPPRILEIRSRACEVTDGRTCPRLVARWIRESQADIVILRDLAPIDPRTPGGNQPAWLGELLGWNVVSSVGGAAIASPYAVSLSSSGHQEAAAYFRGQEVQIAFQDDAFVASQNGCEIPVERRQITPLGLRAVQSQTDSESVGTDSNRTSVCARADS